MCFFSQKLDAWACHWLLLSKGPTNLLAKLLMFPADVVFFTLRLVAFIFFFLKILAMHFAHVWGPTWVSSSIRMVVLKLLSRRHGWPRLVVAHVVEGRNEIRQIRQDGEEELLPSAKLEARHCWCTLGCFHTQDASHHQDSYIFNRVYYRLWLFHCYWEEHAEVCHFRWC